METKKIIVNVSWLDNFGACSDSVLGCVATSDTLEGVKQKYAYALQRHINGMIEDETPLPEPLKGSYELVFELNVQALLHHFDGILTRAALSRITNINQSQLGHYITGSSHPRKEQKVKIINGLHKIGKELISVE
jgi:predicted RNase H-like HicB family nuclease